MIQRVIRAGKRDGFASLPVKVFDKAVRKMTNRHWFYTRSPRLSWKLEVEENGTNILFMARTEDEYNRCRQGGKSILVQPMLETASPGDVVYDIGACLGTVSCILGASLRQSEVYAFEPLPSNLRALRENFEINNIDGEIFPVALSDADGEDQLAVPKDVEGGYGNSSIALGGERTEFRHDKEESIPVTLKRGDGMVEEEDLPVPNIVSIDVEGAEQRVIEGLENTLAHEDCRAMFVEVHEYMLPHFGDDAKSMEAKIRSLGFGIERYDERVLRPEIMSGEEVRLYRIKATKNDPKTNGSVEKRESG